MPRMRDLSLRLNSIATQPECASARTTADWTFPASSTAVASSINSSRPKSPEWRIRIAVTTPIERQYAPVLGNQWQKGPKDPSRSTPSRQEQNRGLPYSDIIVRNPRTAQLGNRHGFQSIFTATRCPLENHPPSPAVTHNADLKEAAGVCGRRGSDGDSIGLLVLKADGTLARVGR